MACVEPRAVSGEVRLKLSGEDCIAAVHFAVYFGSVDVDMAKLAGIDVEALMESIDTDLDPGFAETSVVTMLGMGLGWEPLEVECASGIGWVAELIEASAEGKAYGFAVAVETATDSDGVRFVA